MFSQTLSFGMMLQQAMSTQQKYKANLPLEFPYISAKIRTFKELTEQLISQVEFMCANHIQQLQFMLSQQQLLQLQQSINAQHADLSTIFPNVRPQTNTTDYQMNESKQSEQQEENMTFQNEKDEKTVSLMMAEDQISKLAKLLTEKDSMIQTMQKQIQKSIGLENLQYKYDLQSKRIQDLQALIREKDSRIEQLTQTSIEQIPLRSLSTPRPNPSTKQVDTACSQKQLSSPSIFDKSNEQRKFDTRNMTHSQNYFYMDQVQIHRDLYANSPILESNDNRNYTMPLQIKSQCQDGGKNNLEKFNQKSFLPKLDPNTLLALVSTSKQDLMMRCALQAEEISKLVREIQNKSQSQIKESDKDLRELLVQVHTISLTKRQATKDQSPHFQRYDNLSIEEIIQELKSSLSKLIEKMQMKQRKQFQRQKPLINSKEVSNCYFEQSQDLSMHLMQNSNSQSMVISKDTSPNTSRMRQPETKRDKSLKAVSRERRRVADIRGQADQVKSEYVEEKLKIMIETLEKEKNNLRGELKIAEYKTFKLQAAFKQIESIFSSQSQDDEESNDRLILKQIEDLNSVHINKISDLQKENDCLKEKIEVLQIQIQAQNERVDCMIKERQVEEQEQIKQGQSSNMFKRTNAIKKAQGFFQGQKGNEEKNDNGLYDKSNYQSVASLAYSDSTCSTQDAIIKKYNHQNRDFQALNDMMTSHSREALYQCGTTISTNPSMPNLRRLLSQDEGILIMNNQDLPNPLQKDVEYLKDQVAALEKEKSLLDLEYQSTVVRLQKEVSELNVIKDSYDLEKQSNYELNFELEKKEKLIRELQRKINDLSQALENSSKQSQDRQDQCDELKTQLTQLKEAQIILKNLIEEERKAYNEDRERYETDMDKVCNTHETRFKILKTKLIPLFDGTPEEARLLSMDELVEGIKRKVQKSINTSSSNSSRRAYSQKPADKKESTEIKIETKNEVDSSTHRELHHERKVSTNHENYKKFSCFKATKSSIPMTITENDSASGEQLQQLIGVCQNMNNNCGTNHSLTKTSIFAGQEQMTKIIELCAVQNFNSGIKPESQLDFMQMNISPIKKQKNKQVEPPTATSFENGEADENRIMSADQYNNLQSKRNNEQKQIISVAPTTKHQNFIQSNNNHQKMIYPVKSTQSLHKQAYKENSDPCFSDEAYKKCTQGGGMPALINHHDLPLQIKSINTPQFSQNSSNLYSQRVSIKPLENVSQISQHGLQQNGVSTLERPRLQLFTDRSALSMPFSQSSGFNTATATTQVTTSMPTQRGQSATRPAGGEKLNSILENFRKEKSVFNQKFQELKQKLETFNSPQAQQPEIKIENQQFQDSKAQQIKDIFAANQYLSLDERDVQLKEQGRVQQQDQNHGQIHTQEFNQKLEVNVQHFQSVNDNKFEENEKNAQNNKPARECYFSQVRKNRSLKSQFSEKYQEEIKSEQTIPSQYKPKYNIKDLDQLRETYGVSSRQLEKIAEEQKDSNRESTGSNRLQVRHEKRSSLGERSQMLARRYTQDRQEQERVAQAEVTPVKFRVIRTGYE